jgi:hypothetical protein
MDLDWLPDLFAMEIIAATQVTITETTIALVASWIPPTERTALTSHFEESLMH